eukprot:CAMPEP_0172488132 /NCGR_PEP_ID=MMETSP1066-20121228/17521_1 /TAXON_ID=671091 /ORGANISM="Coscinodiscus wailesii, Strain CCMP2513" /LENGTH=151 /DNA_ID=CAMNT_0013255155 /DNA_START=99 /DNA_END=554 /DNA_ORIENTATION=-
MLNRITNGMRMAGMIDGDKTYDAKKYGNGSVGVQILAHWFGKLVGKVAMQKLKVFLDELPADIEQCLNKYKHTANIFYIDGSGNYQTKDLMEIPFEDNEDNKKYLLEYHSVCPTCVGEIMIRRQRIVNEYIKKKYYPDTEKEGTENEITVK